MSDFVHLHVHTEYSLLDGLNRTKSLFEKVAENKMDATAITDHGVLYGVPEFWKMSKDFHVKPIIGCEVYLAPGPRQQKKEVDGIKYYHLLLIAKNNVGYQNLVKLVTKSHMEGFYYKPRVDLELLKQHSEGLICTSACLAGPLSRHITRNEYAKAEDWLQKLHNIYQDDFYLEIQRNGLRAHDEIDEELIKNLAEVEKEDQLGMLKQQIKVNQQLYKYSDQYNIPLIATTDAHYLNAEDKETQKILFCIRDGKTVDDPTAMNGYVETYIKTPQELQETFSDIPEVMEETLKINEKIEKVELKPDRVQPEYWNLPKGKTSKEELARQTWEGAQKKYGEINQELEERIKEELMVIDKMGYNDYFLVVGDLMQFARRNEIVIGVRGSAAASVVSYVLGITNIDPIKWGLVFERFLNLERASPPDIDMDIQDDRREEIVEYAKEMYGEYNVASIITFNKLATKAAIRDVARAMGVDLTTADQLSKKVIVLFGKPYSFEDMMQEDEEFKEMVESDPQLQKLGEFVKKIEGINRHTGVHAAGYLITPQPVDEYMAYQQDPKDESMILTQVDGTWVDKLDYMKFDFLGLRTLTIIKNAIIYIRERQGININLEEVNVNPTDGGFDENALNVFREGATVGVFQFESPPMQQYLKDLQPENLADICFMAAAYRPGPMEHIPDYIDIRRGRKQPEYIVPELEPILEDTLGFPVYQEQLLKITQKLGGFSLGDGDIIRNALKKKQLDILQEKEQDFKKYFLENYDYGQEVADKIWKQLEPFASYGFNKAHAASYAAVAYWCAYLKGNYPLEYMTSLMHSDLENLDRIIIDIKEAQRLGFSVEPPDVNKSDVYFAPEGKNTIRFGLGAVKNVGVKMCQAIVQARQEQGEFKNMDDFIYKVGPENLNKKALECLIMVGALDDFGERNALLAVMPGVYDRLNKQGNAAAVGQTSMFAPASGEAEATQLPKLDPVSDTMKIQWEKELMGVFLSTHPLDKYYWSELLPNYVPINELVQLADGAKVKTLAIIDERKIIRTKAENKQMSFLSISDKTGVGEAVLFPDAHAEYMDIIEEARPYVIDGNVSHKDDSVSILIKKLKPIKSLKPPKQIKINICGVENKEELQKIKDCISDAGEIELKIVYGEKTNPKVLTKTLKLTPECVSVISKYIVRDV